MAVSDDSLAPFDDETLLELRKLYPPRAAAYVQVPSQTSKENYNKNDYFELKTQTLTLSA